MDRLLVGLAADGGVSVGTRLDGEFPAGAAGKPRKLAFPLDADALEDLRWYLEDYLRAPFGVWEDRGPAVEAKLASWGEAVFDGVFGAGAARDAYERVRARGGGVQVMFRSGSARWLGLPWELMRDPDQDMPLALESAGMDRSLPSAELGASFEVPGGRLRVLMVISRPAGAGDVGYQMIARPLLARLEPVRGAVDLAVLRPPTLEALDRTLKEAVAAGEPFQVVHFDGHGAMSDGRAAGGGAPGTSQDDASEGVLVFQGPGGGRDPVSASRVGQVLAASRVPVVVLNACQSGAIGKQLEAAVATRLLRGGAASVVAMAYSVYAVAAAEFMAAFYERLFAGDTVSVAVTAGREQMFRRPGRPSPKGKLALADWLVPVHYARREVSFPGLVTARPAGEPSLEQALDRLRDAGGSDRRDVLAPVGVFTGRDGLFFELEAAARLQHVMVLHGPAGTGKTELAKAFGRWWRDTSGAERVLWHSFEPGVGSFGLDGVITETGLHIFGGDFARLDPGERRSVVEKQLVDRRLLLIWDNFETVRSMPDLTGATPPLDEAGWQELKWFLSRLDANAKSLVVITSRTPEDWLGPVRRIGVGGLPRDEAVQYAGELLAPHPAVVPRRARRAFGDLLDWLDGHPLSMRLILPSLDNADPEALLDGLRGITPLPGDDPDEDETTSLAASITYSFAHLADKTRRLLPAVCLFHGIADVDVLAAFSGTPEVPGRFTAAGAEDWQDVLDDAARVGLLTPLGARVYRIHPALPAYLAAQWRAGDPGGYDSARDAATRTLATVYAAFGSWLSRQIESGDAASAYAVIELQRRTLGSLLEYAVDRRMWDQALGIVQPLDDYWDARGLDEEAAAWTGRVRIATEDPDGTPPRLDTSAGALWLFLTGSHASRLQATRLDEAERIHHQILNMLQAEPTARDRQADLAVVYNELGTVAGLRGRLEEAEDWFGKSLAIKEALGDRPGMASSYHQLGNVAGQRRRLWTAEGWYRKSLTIFKELGNQPAMAATYHQLGVIFQERGRLRAAGDWYRKSLAIKEALRDRPGTAASYHQLGNVAELQGRLEDAEDWYRKSLAIKEALGNRAGMAASYHQLGIIARGRGRLQDAEEWHRKSLAICEELGNRAGMASSYGQLGLLAEQLGQPREALGWTVRCVAVFGEFPHPLTGPGPQHLVHLTALLGMNALEDTWQEATGNPLPQAVGDYVRSRPA